ncbi:MAG: hypothetical protein ABIF87_03770 [Pseudomonadota bacterium]
MGINYLFRKPAFPIICDIDGYVIGAKTEKALLKKLSELELRENEFYNVIDKTGEGWSLYTHQNMMISPLTFKKKWTKLEIIKMYNDRKNNKGITEKKYSEKSLSSKPLRKILSDIIDLASKL